MVIFRARARPVFGSSWTGFEIFISDQNWSYLCVRRFLEILSSSSILNGFNFGIAILFFYQLYPLIINRLKY